MNQPRQDDEIRLAVIGCGGFGLFALQHFARVPGVTLAGIGGTHREAALAAAERFGLEHVEDVDDLLQRDDVDLVYVATPPFLHHEQTLRALEAGKHVICEKPLALTLPQADELIAAAHDRDLLLVTNLMQRYNPLFDSVKSLIERRVLGEVLHGQFVNDAADEGLSPDHWFWDREKSGGIFVEHGVHFFDLLAGWLGEGDVVSAQSTRRPGTDVEEQVRCTVRYGEHVLFDFYHGFHQPARLERQELRLVLERGEIVLHEWIPSRYRVRALVDEAAARELCDLFPDARLDVSAVYAGSDRACRGRQHDYDAQQIIELSGGFERPKLHRYGDLLRAMLADQIAWIHDRSHPRRVTECNGRDSLALALRAASGG